MNSFQISVGQQRLPRFVLGPCSLLKVARVGCQLGFTLILTLGVMAPVAGQESDVWPVLELASTLQKNIDDFSVLIDSSPQIVLCTVNLHEYFIYIEGITKSLAVAFIQCC